MSWYRVGSIAVTNGSPTVTGTGTAWIANVAIGEGLRAPDGRIYEITNIASDTSLTITPNYLGATQTGQVYEIVPTQSFIRDLATQAADLVNQYSTIANFAGQGKFGDGTVTAPGIRFSDDLDTGIYRIGSNNLGISAGGTKIVDVSTSGISVTGTINGTTVPTSATLVTTTGTQTLTNKTLTSPVIGTIVNTGTLTLPTSTDTLVGRATTDTLTNKTLTSPTITGTGTAAFGNLSYTGTLTGSTGILNIGSGQIYKDASGNVGVGTATPARAVSIFRSTFPTLQLTNTSTGQASADGSILQLNSDDALVIRNQENSYISFDTNLIERMRITSAGDVGIGINSPAVPLHVVNASTPRIYIGSDASKFAGVVYTAGATFGSVAIRGQGNDTGTVVHVDRDNNQVRFDTSGTERARITSAGDFYIGTTAEPNGTSAYGSAFVTATNNRRILYIASSTTATQTMANFYNPNGGVGSITTSGSATSYNTSSDYRLKENIVDAPSASDSIDAIQIRSFDWKADGSHQKYGVIAQELEPIEPRAVTKGETEDDMWGVDYSKLVPMLIKEVQSLRARVSELESK